MPPAQVGATIGVLERLLIVTLLLVGATRRSGSSSPPRRIARFRLLDDRDFAEYYLLGTLASVVGRDRQRARSRGPRSRRLSRALAPQAGVASRASRSVAARSVSSRFGKANRSFVRPSSGRE